MIEMHNVCAGYGQKQVLHNVNMKFTPGKVTAVIGPNGCGKSTLLKTLVRILKTTSGQIRIQGKSLETFGTAELARAVAYLPQSKRAPDMSVLRMVLHGRFAYLTYPRKYRKEDLETARKAIAWAGLEKMEEEMVSHLSGGMQQKAYIAMALAQDADTILMDEPTTYLDVAHQFRLMEMAGALAKEGKAVVMVLHDLSLALRNADEVILLKDGSVMQAGTPDEVYESGALEMAFEVQIEKVETKSGTHYVLS